MKTSLRSIACVGAMLIVGAGVGSALTARRQVKDTLGFQDTPLVPGTKWHVGDGLRPQPKAVDPGTFSSDEKPGTPPSDAMILFDGKDLSKWNAEGGGDPKWKIENGMAVCVKGAGGIRTKDELGNVQFHIEWSEPENIGGSSQGRGNSGVLFFGRYEVQVLDSYHNPTYADGGAGAIYGTYPPMVNATKKPGEWNVYDILFSVPLFDAAGKLSKPGYFTVFHNGVCVQNHVELLGDSNFHAAAVYHAHPPKGSLVLQNHGDPVRYRNIWYRELKSSDDQ